MSPPSESLTLGFRDRGKLPAAVAELCSVPSEALRILESLTDTVTFPLLYLVFFHKKKSDSFLLHRGFSF